MKKMFSWLVISIAIVFWIFRVIVCYTNAIGIDIGYKAFNLSTEILVLFISLFSIILVIGRWRIGGILYLVSYVFYFGMPAFNGILNIFNGNQYDYNDIMDTIISVFAILIAIGMLLDVIVNNDRHESKDKKSTYWFYNNKKFDRELDERADKNHYRLQ